MRQPSTCRFPTQAFDTTLAQLVAHFMADPVTGLREMARVTRKHGVVAACVWDHAGGQGPLSVGTVNASAKPGPPLGPAA